MLTSVKPEHTPTVHETALDDDNDARVPRGARTATFTPPPSHPTSNLPLSWFGIVEWLPLQLRPEWPTPPGQLAGLVLGRAKPQRLPRHTALMPRSARRGNFPTVLGQPIRPILHEP